MINGELFDKLEEIARRVRFKEEPFGGIQLIVTGDFCQLPPVPDLLDGIPFPPTFAFDAESWSKCIGVPMTLKYVFRQRNQAFIDMLNDMRWGQMSEQTISKLYQLSREVPYEDGIEPTELYPTRVEVEEANDTRLAQITENTVYFYAEDRPGFDERGERVSSRKMARLLNRLVALPTVVLRVIRSTCCCCAFSISARLVHKLCSSRHVLCSFDTHAKLQPRLQNLVQGHLVNGTTGKVIGFLTRFAAARRRLLLAGRDKPEDHRLAAVKRCDTLWPLVMFTNGSEYLCVPEVFSVTGARGNVEASRTQVREHQHTVASITDFG
ncbi:hypothetical protein EI94DRAFT_1677246 [Lactarius quietus]|nr:hypothetical protein EI94DRAFT_1677246 [Lactarius quietus]